MALSLASILLLLLVLLCAVAAETDRRFLKKCDEGTYRNHRFLKTKIRIIQPTDRTKKKVVPSSSDSGGQYQHVSRRYLPGDIPGHCTKCPVGRYQNVNNLDSKGVEHCKICEAGKYNDQDNQKACTLCPTGKYSRLTVPIEMECYLAYCNTFDDLKRYYCDGGTCTSASHASKCMHQWAKDGTTQQSRQAASPEPCITSLTCVDCPLGKYSATPGQWAGSCTFCPTGQSTENPGQTLSNACQNCATGFFENGNRKCELCPNGQMTVSNL